MTKRFHSLFSVSFGTFGLVIGLLLLLNSFFFGSKQAAAREAASLGDVITATLTLTASRDNTLYENEAGPVSNGGGSHFFVGRTQNGALRRGVLAFDVAEGLPTDATIVSATLSLHMSKTNNGAQTAVSLHAIQNDWGEGSTDAPGEEGQGAAAELGDVTWLHTFFDSSTWTQPGGDFDEIPLATTMVGGNGRYQWHTTELTDSVLSWYINPLDNFGWLLIGNEENVGSAKRFDTRENPIAANQPALTIVYTVPKPVIQLYIPIVRR